MRRTLRVILVIVVVLVLLVLVAPFLIPVNQFRPTIEQKASAALGRKVDVGNLSLSLFTGSLAADNLSIADDPKFSNSPFLTAKSIKVGVELVPLVLRKDLIITNIVIDAPQVTLLRNPGGEWNYSSFGASAAKSQESQAGNAKPQTPAQQAPPQQAENPSSSNANEFSVQKLELRDGRIVVGSTNSQKRSTYDKVDLTASNVSLTTKFPVTLNANLPGGGNLKLDGAAGPLDQQNTALTPVSAKLTVNNLNLASTGFLDPSAGLGGILDFNATTASQNGEADVNGTANLSKALLVSGGSPASVPLVINFKTKYDLRKNRGVLEPSTLKIGNDVAHLNGTYEVPAEGSLIMHLKVDGQNMPAKDLEAFLPALGVHMPNGASLQGGTLNVNLDLNGPTDKLVTSGNVGMFNAKLAGFDLGSKMSAVGSLVGLNTGKDLDIEKMTTDARVAPTGIEVQHFQAILPALGTLVGNGAIDAKNNLDFKMAATLKGGVGAVAGAAGNAATAGAGNAVGGLLGKVTGAAGIGSAAGNFMGNCKNASGGSGPTIPFQIKGTTSDPKFVPDVGGVAAGMLKSQLGCFGGGSQAKGTPGQQQPNPNNPIDAIGGLFKKKKP